MKIKPIKKLLIANRGEIAVRIIKTCKKMGIETVVVYSDADRNSVATSLADEIYYLGPSIASESYLRIDKILAAIKHTGADAVHPGYGFLSEKTSFAKALEDVGCVFVGPNSKAIDMMGDKISSKLLAQKAGVSIIPGYNDIIKDADHAVQIAIEVGFPVMLKASAGGGGKGIRIARDAEETHLLFQSVTNEGIKSFGDGRIFIEKFIENPRHIEIQVIADKHGNIVCLGDRECSIQRNNQKVIEEAPSSFMTEEVRQEMYKQVRQLAEVVGYDSAGTVEFVMDANRKFYFLEMNTRLQVEHPVTEYITGVDLVELMIRSAAGEKLPIKQGDVKLNGHSFECRICAEDPSKGFIPSTGWIDTYIAPPETEFIRVDTGVKEGYTISQYYDSMIAKLITYGKNREEARLRMLDALGKFVINGVDNNIMLLESILRKDKFVKGDITTAFIKNEYPDGFKIKPPSKSCIDFFVLAVTYLRLRRLHRLTALPTRFNKDYASKALSVYIDDQEFNVEIVSDVKDSNKSFEVVFKGCRYTLSADFELHHKVLTLDILPHDCQQDNAVVSDLKQIENNEKSDVTRGITENKSIGFKVWFDGVIINLSTLGFTAKCMVVSSSAIDLMGHCLNKDTDASKVTDLESPISGLLTNIYVNEGDVVNAGKSILTIEAMKMENMLVAESDVRVKKINYKVGDIVSIGDTIIELEPAI